MEVAHIKVEASAVHMAQAHGARRGEQAHARAPSKMFNHSRQRAVSAGKNPSGVLFRYGLEVRGLPSLQQGLEANEPQAVARLMEKTLAIQLTNEAEGTHHGDTRRFGEL